MDDFSWEQFLDYKSENGNVKIEDVKEGLKLMALQIIEEIEECKNFHEVCQVVQTLRLRYE